MSDKMSKPHYVRTDVSCLYCIFDEQGRRVRACPGCITRMKLAPTMIVESEEEKRRVLATLRARVTALEGTVATLQTALADALVPIGALVMETGTHKYLAPELNASLRSNLINIFAVLGQPLPKDFKETP